MGKQQRVSERERIRRNRQRNEAQFDRWCKHMGQPNCVEALILYRMIGRKRYRSTRKKGGGDGQQR